MGKQKGKEEHMANPSAETGMTAIQNEGKEKGE